MDITKIEETQNQRNAWQLHHDAYLLEQAELKMEEAKQRGLVPPGRGQKRKTLHETTELKKSLVPPPPGSVGTLEDRNPPIHAPLPIHTAQERQGSLSKRQMGLKAILKPIYHSTITAEDYQKTIHKHHPNLDVGSEAKTRQALRDRGIDPDTALRLVSDLVQDEKKQHKKSPLLHEIKKRVSHSEQKELFADLLAKSRKEEQQEAEERLPPGPNEVLLSDPRANEMSAGEERRRQLEQVLQDQKPPRSIFQEQFHDECIPAILPHIYGAAEFNRSYATILESLDRDVLPIMILLHLYRRGGKTDGAGRLAAACGDIIPDGKTIICLAQTLEMAQIFLGVVKSFFMQSPNAQQRIIKNTASEFHVIPRHINVEHAKSSGKASTIVNKFRACAGTLRSKFSFFCCLFFCFAHTHTHYTP